LKLKLIPTREFFYHFGVYHAVKTRGRNAMSERS